ncbi:MAG: hypothetical protein SGPRY_006947, partial [Prymnesium sp.]
WLGEEELSSLFREHSEHGDVLLLEAPESSMLLKRPTKYSNFTKKGRGMPTYAFFQHAAAFLPGVPWVGKLDDDTVPNLPLLLPLLSSLRCLRTAFLGAMNFAGVVPLSRHAGVASSVHIRVRADRCGFGWTLNAALSNFGKDVGTPGQAWRESRISGQGYWPACDRLGAVLPFPYGIGAEAYGPGREEGQWQKFEDTTTGYWLSYSPERVQYIDIGAWVHNMHCDQRGEIKRRGGALSRPPSNESLLVHDLKHGGALPGLSRCPLMWLNEAWPKMKTQ